MNRRAARAFGVALVLAVGAASLPALAVTRPSAAPPADFDLRQAPSREALDAPRAEAAWQAIERFGPGVRAHFGDLSERPHYLFRPGGVLAVLGGDDAVALAREFLRSAPEVFGLSPDEVASLETVREYRTPAAGLTHLAFLQRVGGISVFRGQISVNLDDRGGVVNVGGEFFPGLTVEGEPVVTAASALRTAALGIGLSGKVPEVVESRGDAERYTRFAAGGEYLEPAEARLVVLPEAPRSGRLTWEVRLWEAVTGADHQYRVLVDARSGAAVLRELLTLYAAPAEASGKVFGCSDPDRCAQDSTSFAGNAQASPAWWVAAGQTLSQGNNVAARSDPAGTNPLGEAEMADGGTQLTFDFRFRNSWAHGNWEGDRDSGITNAFYWGNVIHDHWYALGFDEAAGNYQADNFGLGGLGGDRVNVDVQDSASRFGVRNNANWNPTNDGNMPRTNYYLWTEPERDGAFDATVIWHEFGHGLSTRLIGGPSVQCLSGTQGGGMGEGWGDWVAVNYFAEESDDPAGPVIVGGYVTDNLQAGIRRYPYHHDMAVNPLTYDDLCDGGSCEVHDEGEIWAQILWDVRHDLILALGFAEGRLRAEQLIIDAMKLSPCSPNFVTMRDSILQADQQRYGGADLCPLRAAFARRGLGAGAASVGTGGNNTADFSLILPLGASVGMAADKATLEWQPQAAAQAYRVARGTFSSDPALNAFDDAACVGQSGGPSFEDAAIPAAGFYYLVAVDDGCVISGWGTRSDGTPRPVACP